MAFPWNNKSIKHEEGMFTAVGEGELVIFVHFRPNSTRFEVIGNVNDPTPLSNDPNPPDWVMMSLKRPHKFALFRLHFQWKVFGSKEIRWVVDG